MFPLLFSVRVATLAFWVTFVKPAFSSFILVFPPFDKLRATPSLSKHASYYPFNSYMLIFFSSSYLLLVLQSIFFLPTNSWFRRCWQNSVNAVAETNYLYYCAHFSSEQKTLFGILRTLRYIFQCTNFGTFVCNDGLFIRVETGLTQKLFTLFFSLFFFFPSLFFVFLSISQTFRFPWAWDLMILLLCIVGKHSLFTLCSFLPMVSLPWFP